MNAFKLFNTYPLLTLALFFSVLFIGGTHSAHAQEPWRAAVDKINYKTMTHKLPPFCSPGSRKKAPFNGPSYGEDMVWGNHVCDAIAKIPTCRRYFGSARVECLGVMANSYTYWLNHAQNPKFALRPYIHTDLGRLYMEMNQKSSAIQEFKMALKHNPKYVKAYKSIIDAYMAIGDLANAQQYLDKGLSIKENSKSLKRRQSKLNKLEQKP